MIDAVLCDIGGILAEYDDNRTVHVLAKGSLYGADIIRARLFAFGGIVPAYAKGRLSTEEFRHAVRDAFHLGDEFDDGMIDDAFAGEYVLHGSTALVIGALRKGGITTTAVSNTEPLRHRPVESSGILRCFDHLVLSYEEGLLKPSEELMVRALDRSAASAERSVFIDDRVGNLGVARELGMHVHRYTDPESLADFLGSFDVPGPPSSMPSD